MIWKPLGGRRTAATAILLAALATAAWSPPAAAQQADELVVLNCSSSDLRTLRRSIASRLGVQENRLRISHIVVYSDLDNFGQPAASGGTTGPVICVGPGYAAAGTPPGTPFPTESVDIFESATSTRVRIEATSPLPNPAAPADVVACEAFDGSETCVRINTP